MNALPHEIVKSGGCAVRGVVKVEEQRFSGAKPLPQIWAFIPGRLRTTAPPSPAAPPESSATSPALPPAHAHPREPQRSLREAGRTLSDLLSQPRAVPAKNSRC